MEHVTKANSRHLVAPRAFTNLLGCPRVRLNSISMSWGPRQNRYSTLLGRLGVKILSALGSKLRLGLLNKWLPGPKGIHKFVWFLNKTWNIKGGSNATTLYIVGVPGRENLNNMSLGLGLEIKARAPERTLE